MGSSKGEGGQLGKGGNPTELGVREWESSMELRYQEETRIDKRQDREKGEWEESGQQTKHLHENMSTVHQPLTFL